MPRRLDSLGVASVATPNDVCPFSYSTSCSCDTNFCLVLLFFFFFFISLEKREKGKKGRQWASGETILNNLLSRVAARVVVMWCICHWPKEEKGRKKGRCRFLAADFHPPTHERTKSDCVILIQDDVGVQIQFAHTNSFFFLSFLTFLLLFFSWEWKSVN